jgi:hypothetical protein
LENDKIFYAHLDFLQTFGTKIHGTPIFGIFCVHLVYFSGFGIKYQEKSGNPGFKLKSKAFFLLCFQIKMYFRESFSKQALLTYVTRYKTFIAYVPISTIFQLKKCLPLPTVAMEMAETVLYFSPS